MCHQVTLLTPAGTDGSGNPTPPALFTSTWAAVRTLAGLELEKAQLIAQEATHLVVTPYLSGVSESMTLQFENRFFQIHYVEDPDERRMELRWYCAEIGQNAGQ
jgi:SPP1 family predicted phage head-tail adaptor